MNESFGRAEKLRVNWFIWNEVTCTQSKTQPLDLFILTKRWIDKKKRDKLIWFCIFQLNVYLCFLHNAMCVFLILILEPSNRLYNNFIKSGKWEREREKGKMEKLNIIFSTIYSKIEQFHINQLKIITFYDSISIMWYISTNDNSQKKNDFLEDLIIPAKRNVEGCLQFQNEFCLQLFTH